MKRLMALLLALVFTLTLAGCANTPVPETVGSLGSVEIPGSLYRLVQYNNYSGAASLTPSSPSQPRLLPRHPFLKSVPQCGTPNLFTFHYSLFT